jgi:CRISPR-associated protein Csb2
VIAIEVELLTRRYVATSFNDRRAPEWPPHPARLFSALVATASEQEDLREVGRRALEWLEGQGSPRVLASPAAARTIVDTYVPGNTTRVLDDPWKHEEKLRKTIAALEEADRAGDAKSVRRARAAVDKAETKLAEQLAKVTGDDGDYNASARANAMEMLPEHRGKQPRTLPSVTPEQPRVRFLWSDAMPDDEVRDALSTLARRMVRLGHSATLVSCRVVEAGAEQTGAEGLDTWIPAEHGGGETLRTVTPGQLARLDRAYERHRGVDPRVLPAWHQAYRRLGASGVAEPARSVFAEWLVLREVAPAGGRRLGLQLTRAEDVARALRGALLHHADDPPPAVLSGHGPDGAPLDRPHVAFIALADVASRYSSGVVLGAAVVLPRDIDPADRMAILRAVGRWERAGLRLVLGRTGVLSLERVVEGAAPSTLEPATWTRPSRRWASVTPVALDENPGDLSSRDPEAAARAVERAEEIVARACERIGLPRPRWVQVMRRSLFDAAPPAARFMPFPRNGCGLRRVCVHVEIRFEEPVGGPVVLGAGRYFGLGLCRPRREE